MPSLVLDNYSISVDSMMKESGDRSFPIWLLVNPKYPTDVLNIWNPIMYEIQDKVYRKLHARINSRNIYIKNAISNIGRVSHTSSEAEVNNNITMLKKSVLEYQPKLIITFGTITTEFVRRVFDVRPEKEPNHWSTSNLGYEFERSIANFDITQTNWIPLNRRTMRATTNIKDWEEGKGHYQDVATKMADLFIENKDSLEIWI
ncbi:hypothetical protein [Desulfosporosinus nitroreducens]|uniref:hypothetical protein n=1 Tax=Desulfosporosinus nitroreducens TaxID=2018668 RepID=UPI00207D54F7|nr:hypothetical protein [Desulfosporosinus nitroreducens]MCO1602908.1 hypothetical protein [Desulfosporosinus nitroreducens]